MTNIKPPRTLIGCFIIALSAVGCSSNIVDEGTVGNPVETHASAPKQGESGVFADLENVDCKESEDGAWQASFSVRNTSDSDRSYRVIMSIVNSGFSTVHTHETKEDVGVGKSKDIETEEFYQSQDNENEELSCVVAAYAVNKQ